jgi:hypothetical protein
MKDLTHIKKFTEILEEEDFYLYKFEELINQIEAIIYDEVDLRNVPYSDDDSMEKDPTSVTKAATEIVKMLKVKKII